MRQGGTSAAPRRRHPPGTTAAEIDRGGSAAASFYARPWLARRAGLRALIDGLRLTRPIAGLHHANELARLGSLACRWRQLIGIDRLDDLDGHCPKRRRGPQTNAGAVPRR